MQAIPPLVSAPSALLFAALKAQTYRTPEGSLVVRQTGGVAAKLFGLPFAAVGVWFLYQFLMAFIDIVKAPKGSLPYIPGLLLLLVMMLAFGAPGVLLMFGKRLVTVDAMTREVSAVRDYVFTTRAERFARDEIEAVSISHERLSSSSSDAKSNSRPVYAYHVEVELKRKGAENVLVGLAGHVDEARTLATEFAAAANLPMRDRTDEKEPEEEEESVEEEA